MPIYGSCGAGFSTDEGQLAAQMVQRNLQAAAERQRERDAYQDQQLELISAIEDPIEKLVRAMTAFSSCGHMGGGPYIHSIDARRLVKAVTGADYVQASGVDWGTKVPDDVSWNATEVACWFAEQAVKMNVPPNATASRMVEVRKHLRGTKTKYGKPEPVWRIAGGSTWTISGGHAAADIFRDGAIQLGSGEHNLRPTAFSQIHAMLGLGTL